MRLSLPCSVLSLAVAGPSGCRHAPTVTGEGTTSYVFLVPTAPRKPEKKDDPSAPELLTRDVVEPAKPIGKLTNPVYPRACPKIRLFQKRQHSGWRKWAGRSVRMIIFAA
jgi:hypothetical protein